VEPEDVGKPDYIQRPIFLCQWSRFRFQPPFHGVNIIFSVAIANVSHQSSGVVDNAQVPADSARLTVKPTLLALFDGQLCIATLA
jgi:hypothetical protein